MIPGLSVQRAILFRTDTLVAAAFRFEAFPSGFKFTIHVEGNAFTQGQSHFVFSPGTGWPDPHAPDHEKGLDDIFRVGLEFSDGTAADHVVDIDRGGLGIYSQGCSGSGGFTGWGRCTGKFWVPALPPPGEFTLHVQWPALGIDEHSTAFNADDIIDKSTQALPLLG